jgi:hypothetical protein
VSTDREKALLCSNSVSSGYGEPLGRSIVAAAQAHHAFFEIISRPSMLPVVATIWSKINSLQGQGHDLTSAILMEYYLEANYRRKTEEIEREQSTTAAPDDASYLLLPQQVREVFTLAVIWKMASSDAKNTIDRRRFDEVIKTTYGNIFKAFQTKGVPEKIIQRVRRFEERFRHETEYDKIERVSSEVASAGIFVPDPAGGPSNLRLPHKQFYEYMISKVAWTILSAPQTLTSKIYQSVATKPFEILLAEDVSMMFVSEMIGPNCSAFRMIFNKWTQILASTSSLMAIVVVSCLMRFARGYRDVFDVVYLRDEGRFNWENERRYAQLFVVSLASVVALTAAALILLLKQVETSATFMVRLLGAFTTAISLVIASIIVSTPFWAVLMTNLFGAEYRVLKRIVSMRLISTPEFGRVERLPLRRLYEECLFVFWKSSKSAVCRIDTQSVMQRQLHDLIAPVV